MSTETELLEMTSKSLTGLAEQINTLHAEMEVSMRRTLQDAANLGDRLIAAKEAMPHGNFQSWLGEHCTVKYRQAAKYMQLARGMPALLNVHSNACLSIDEALKLAAKPRNDAKCIRDPLLPRGRDVIRPLSKWFDIVASVCLLLGADGADADEIEDRTGFDRHEVDCILNPEKPVRFANHEIAKIFKDPVVAVPAYNAAVDLRIASFIAHSYWRPSSYWLEAERMTHLKPVIDALLSFWRRKDRVPDLGSPDEN